MSLKCILQGQDSKNLATKEELNQHIEDKGNPHEVTAEQVGAYDKEYIDTRLNNYIRYDIVQSLTDAQRLQARNNIRAAPSGYGLGQINPNSPEDQDADKITETGWYMATVNTPTNGWWIINAITYGDVRYQYAYANEGASGTLMGTVLQRSKKKAADDWTPWEYINPPMILGVEYRTTERYQTKPVYVKAVTFGTMPANAKKAVAHGIDNLAYVLAYSGAVGYWAWPSVPWVSNIEFTGTDIEITTNADKGAYATTIILKYFKTTD